MTSNRAKRRGRARESRPPVRVGEVLATHRHREFVGRACELALLDAMREGDPGAGRVLLLHGPGGTGKTMLLREFLYRQEPDSAVYVDLSRGEPDGGAFEPLRVGPVRARGRRGRHRLLLLDAAEHHGSLAAWLREQVLPDLADDVSVVIAGREAPTIAWRAAPGWNEAMHARALDAFDEAESREYLARRSVPAGEHDAILAFTRGLPLALSLAADVVAQRPGLPFRAAEAPDMLRALTEQLVSNVPTALHAAAIEATAIALTTDEPLLAAMLGVDDARVPFEWLRGLSFMTSHGHGLSPHDAAREAIVADLAWRNRPRLEGLAVRARSYLLGRHLAGDRDALLRLPHELTFLSRSDPALSRCFNRSLSDAFQIDKAAGDDAQVILSAIGRHEGADSRAIAERWLGSRPEAFRVLRPPGRGPAGTLVTLDLEAIREAELEADPCVRKACAWLRGHGIGPPYEGVLVFRWWMSCEAHQALTPVMHRCGMAMIESFISRPDLRFSFSICADDVTYAGVARYLGHEWVRDLAFEIDGHRYHVLGHDWRAQPPLRWLQSLAAGPPAAEPEVPERLAFERGAFERELQGALRNLHRPHSLEASPLLRARIVARRAGSHPDDQMRVHALRRALLESIDALGATPQGAAMRAALDRTYVRPEPTQAAAADAVRMSFSSYRRYLRAGLQNVVAMLWLEETASDGCAPAAVHPEADAAIRN